MLELLKISCGTSNQVILKIDQGNQGNAVELISIGPIGTDHKLSGVRCWHRSASFKHFEWFNIQINNNRNDLLVAWIEISDASRLIKIINSFRELSLSGTLDGDAVCESIEVNINDTEMKLKHLKSCTTFTIPVRCFDADWASSLTIIPPSSPPKCGIKIVSGLDQVAAIFKRVDKWRQDWSVDVLTLKVERSNSATTTTATNNSWDILFEAETSSPPHLNLSTILPQCPETSTTSLSFTECQISVNLTAATRALICPLAESKAFSGIVTGISLFWVPEEALVCNVNWNAAGFGQVASTIYLPNRIIN